MLDNEVIKIVAEDGTTPVEAAVAAIVGLAAVAAMTVPAVVAADTTVPVEVHPLNASAVVVEAVGTATIAAAEMTFEAVVASVRQVDTVEPLLVDTAVSAATMVMVVVTTAVVVMAEGLLLWPTVVAATVVPVTAAVAADTHVETPPEATMVDVAAVLAPDLLGATVLDLLLGDTMIDDTMICVEVVAVPCQVLEAAEVAAAMRIVATMIVDAVRTFTVATDKQKQPFNHTT